MLLPHLRQDQYEIARDPAHIKIVAMGRRWGKTLMAGSIALGEAMYGGQVAWIVPTYRNARALWRFIEQHATGFGTLHRSEMSVQFVSGRLAVYTADNDIALRGEAFDLVIIDEAARIREETYTDVVLPTLADRGGRLIAISTPMGRNWFWREYMRGKEGNPDHRCFNAPTINNPMPNIQRAAELAQTMVSDRTYKQEWLAEFIDEAGGVFRGIDACIRQPPPPNEQSNFVIGVDWGRTHDATVFTVLDSATMQVHAIERMSDTNYSLQVDRLKRLSAIWKPSIILAEGNSMGGPLVEALQRMELPVQSFMTTAITKAPLIDGLALAIERGDIYLVPDRILLNELEAYEGKRLPSGVMRFSAPSGMHDDHVMSLALAVRAASQSARVLFEA